MAPEFIEVKIVLKADEAANRASRIETDHFRTDDIKRFRTFNRKADHQDIEGDLLQLTIKSGIKGDGFYYV